MCFKKLSFPLLEICDSSFGLNLLQDAKSQFHKEDRAKKIELRRYLFFNDKLRRYLFFNENS